jgi:hypothetical protein
MAPLANELLHLLYYAIGEAMDLINPSPEYVQEQVVMLVTTGGGDFTIIARDEGRKFYLILSSIYYNG